MSWGKPDFSTVSNHMVPEDKMGGMILKIAIGIALAYFSYTIRWWTPILTFPLAFLIVPGIGAGNRFEISTRSIEHRRALFYVVSIGFMIAMIALFQKQLGSWYGWLIGMVLSWLGIGSIAADLEKYLFFRTL